MSGGEREEGGETLECLEKKKEEKEREEKNKDNKTFIKREKRN